ncbi:MAG: hypothetical protein JO048_16560 [Methylobacteriaceae bacterium]|nr:hypothetical protein [Methylobacteriaceae bacterium]
MSASDELGKERSALAAANRDIAEGEARIARQAELVHAFRLKQQDCTAAEQLLDHLAGTLSAWREHRELILHRIRTLERIGRE